MNNRNFITALAAVLGLGTLSSCSDNDSRLPHEASEVISDDAGYERLGAALELFSTNQQIPRIPLRELFQVESETSPAQTEKQNEATSKPMLSSQQERRIITTPTLVGIVIRKSGPKAFFVTDNEGFTVSKGDRLDGRYLITGIDPDKVDIKDISTGLGRTIYIKDE